MTKIVALILSFIVLTAHAEVATGYSGALKDAFDELNYALTVEWDQQNQNVYQNEVEKFQARILELKKEGLTEKEFLNFLVSNIKDANAAADLKQFYEIASTQNLNSIEMQDMTQEILNRHYSKGSSWAGVGLLIGAGVLVALVGIVAITLWRIDWISKHCKSDYVCTGGNCWTENRRCD